MAITRAQIARELYIKGGVVNPDGRRGFFKGALDDAEKKGQSISPGTSAAGGTRDDNREQYGAQQTATGVVKGGGAAIKDDSGNVVGFQDNQITG